MIKLTTANFRGSWAGLPVAWDSRHEFDEQTYRSDIARCCRLGVPGVYSGGTTGEFYAMEFDEFKRVACATVQEAHEHGKPAMIGVSSTYTLGAVRRASYAAEIGADAIQVALPYWMEVPATEVVGFFREVAIAAGTMAVSVYETRRSKLALTLEQHCEIKRAIPNYLMVKSNADTVGTTVEGCAGLTALGINVFGDEAFLWPKLGVHGMAGCCSSVVYYAPSIVLPLNDALAARDWPAVHEGSRKLRLLLDFMSLTFDHLGYLDSAGDRLGGIAGGVLRSGLYARGPYPHASESDVQIVRAWLGVNLPDVYANIPAMERLP